MAAQTWTLSTSDTVIELGLRDNTLVVQRLEDVHSRENWLSSPSPLPLLERVGVDGSDRPAAWQYSKALEKSGVLRVEFLNREPSLVLESVWRARPGRGPIEHWVEIRNASPRRVSISQQESLALIGIGPRAASQLWWIKRGGASATTQGGTFSQPLTNGTSLVLTNNCDDGASPVPWLAVQEGEKRGLYLGWEFSGLGRVQALGRDAGLSIAAGLWPGFKTDIEPGETLKIPPAFVGCYSGDLEEGSYSLHRFVIEKLRPPLPAAVPDPILAYNLYLDYGMTNATEADVLRSARFCHELGFEAFMPDAMWYPECGDWRWDPRRFPQGIKPIEAWVHTNGMRQALWCAWSNGGISEEPGALSVRGPNGHPDWFSTNTPAGWTPGPHYGAKLCLGSPEARAWAIEKTQSLVRDYHLDYLKHDSDPIVNRCLQTTHRHHYGVDASYWATLGYYEVQEAMHKKYPHVVIEDCSGGGHIKDFGIIQRTHLIATTDMLSNLADRQSMYDSTFALPPLVLQCYTYDNYFPVKGDEPGDYLWRSAMMGAWHIDPTDTAGWSDDQIDSARQSTRIYKNWIRPMLKDVKVHHVLPRAAGANWDGLFYWSAPLKRGTFFVFRPDSPEPQKTVPLAGLAANKLYWVWSEDGSVSAGKRLGSELMTDGLTVHLTNRFSCDLVYVRDASLGKPKALIPPGRFKLLPASVEADYFTNTVRLHWNENAFARDYRVVISDQPDFQRVSFEKCTAATNTEFRLPSERTWYWKVESRSAGGLRMSNGNPGKVVTKPLKTLPKGIVFASDLPWARATAGAENAVRRDNNIHGQTVRIGRQLHPKAIWTHAFGDATPADVTLDIAGRNLSLFAADVGVEDSAGRGSVVAQLLVDGELKAQSPVLRLGMVHPMQVSVVGARLVTLRILNGGDGNASDHAAWGSARFMEAGANY